MLENNDFKFNTHTHTLTLSLSLSLCKILFRGRNVMMGYLNKLEKTKETINPDGWLHTGDLGRFDEVTHR